MLKNNLIVLNPNTSVLNLKNRNDKLEIENRKKYTYCNKIIGYNNETNNVLKK